VDKVEGKGQRKAKQKSSLVPGKMDIGCLDAYLGASRLWRERNSLPMLRFGDDKIIRLTHLYRQGPGKSSRKSSDCS
jgi:hypothetical protein